MSDNEIQISSQEYEDLLGLLSFDSDATERFIPEPFMKLREDLRPIFVIRPFNVKEKEQYQKLTLRIANINLSENSSGTEVIRINNELAEIVSKAIVDVENFIILGSENNVKEFEKVDGHIKAEDVVKFSELLKKLIFERVQTISGFNRSLKASL